MYPLLYRIKQTHVGDIRIQEATVHQASLS